MRAEFKLAMALLLLASPAVAGGKAGKAPKATYFTVTNLVSNQTGVANTTDANLVNPWGLSQENSGSPLWVSDNGTGLSTVYQQGTGTNEGIVVTIANGSPTGTVYVPPGTGFEVSENGKSGDALFLFDSAAGYITGWTSSVDSKNAVVGYTSTGSNFTGLAIDPSTKLIFATDFANNAVQVIDSTWTLQTSFTDTSLPKGFAPYNVAVINGNLYVTFASFSSSKGYVDVFDESGTLQSHLIKKGKLDAPWGLAVAPSSFGKFAGALLVGNLGNGQINAYNITNGKYLGTLSTAKGKPIKEDGLWSLDAAPSGDITFSAGPNGYADGLIGLISVAN
jgi:uncharacterized protein (TIGR03118 family)